jgi:hypothetical protein
VDVLLSSMDASMQWLYITYATDPPHCRLHRFWLECAVPQWEIACSIGPIWWHQLTCKKISLEIYRS